MVHLLITLKIEAANRAAAAEVYHRYKAAFLEQVKGSQSKQLLVRPEDVAVLHAFDSASAAQDYLESTLFKVDVVGALGPLLAAAPDIRLYEVA